MVYGLWLLRRPEFLFLSDCRPTYAFASVDKLPAAWLPDFRTVTRTFPLIRKYFAWPERYSSRLAATESGSLAGLQEIKNAISSSETGFMQCWFFSRGSQNLFFIGGHYPDKIPAEYLTYFFPVITSFHEFFRDLWKILHTFQSCRQ